MISVCMAYYNRKPELFRTLKTMEQSALPREEFEVIIVDDVSADDHKLDQEYLDQFDIDINLIVVKPEEKTWMNPCMPHNIAFRAIKGDKVIIQNPECLHLGDVLSGVANTLAPKEYRAHRILALCPLDEELIKGISNIEELKAIIEPIVLKTKALGTSATMWYVHRQYRMKWYHFLTAIHTKDLIELGGFDERYANDSAYDDDELVTRIIRKGMNMNLVDEPMGVHQPHPNFDMMNKGPDFRKHNRDLLINHTRKETTICPQPL